MISTGKLLSAVLFLLYATSVFAAAASEQATMENLLNNPESVVYDQPRDRYLVSNWGDGNIVAIDSLGNQTFFNTEMDQAAGLHIVGEVVYAASTEGSVTGIVGFDLTTDTRICTMDIPVKELLNDITSDGSDYLYVTDCDADRIYSVRLSDMTWSILVSTGLGYPNGILYDDSSNRLLVLNGGLPGKPLLAVNLADTSLSVIVETGIGAIDGLSTDENDCTYFSSWTTDRVYRYDSTFVNPPEVVSEGHNDPADIFVNTVSGILAVPNFHGNSLDLIPLYPQSSPAGDETVSFERDISIYPNPFRQVVSIEPSIPSGISAGNLNIYTLCGRLVRTYSNSMESCQFSWDGTDNFGKSVPPGVYVVLYETPAVIASGEIIKL